MSGVKCGGCGAGIGGQACKEDHRLCVRGLCVRVRPSHMLKLFLQERGIDHRSVEAAGSNDCAGIIGQSPDLQLKAVSRSDHLRLGVRRLTSVDSDRHPNPVFVYPKGSDQIRIRDRSWCGHSLIMQENQLVVGRALNIHLGKGASKCNRPVNGCQRIFRGVSAGAAMADAKDPSIGTFFYHGSVLPYRRG